MHDTPLRSLYRLYECTCNRVPNEIMEEGVYFFHYQLKDIPEPRVPDPLRYAILASLALVEAFNFKIKLGLRRGVTHDKPLLIPMFREEADPPYEEPPARCTTVQPSEEMMVIVPRLIKSLLRVSNA